MPFLDSEIEQRKQRNEKSQKGLPLEASKAADKESITASIEATTQEMATIATLKEAIGNYLQLDDIYEYDDDMSYYCAILGRLEISLIRRRGILDSDKKALLEFEK